MSPLYRALLKTARTTHVYVTLFGLVLILFFAVTGFMLNHIEWFAPDKPHTNTVERSLPLDKLPGGKLPAMGEAKPEEEYAIVESLRKEFGIVGEKTAFDNKDEDLIRVGFRRAGEQVDVEIQRPDARTTVKHEYQGWAAVVTDLHRGNRGNGEKEPKFTGRVWTWVIDAACVLLLIIAGTGLIMWYSLKSRGKWVDLLFLTGGMAIFSLYYWFVP